MIGIWVKMFILKRCSGKGAFEAVPKKDLNIDFSKVKRMFKVIASTPVVMLVEFKDCEISCFKNGRLLIKNCKDMESAGKAARGFYSRF